MKTYMKLGVLLVTLLLLVTAVAASDEILSAKSAVIDVTIGSTLQVPEKNVGDIQTLEVLTSMFPRDSNYQKVSNFRTYPEEYDMYNGSIQLQWDNPDEQIIPYGVSARVETNGYQVQVKRKVQYPLDVSLLSQTITTYLDPTEHIDSDDADIVELAAALASGKDDLYDVVFAVATWVNGNIEYNLSTLTADVSQKASWVLDEGYGVCDEMTSLFIALLRSLDIPARYVSGVSYTNSPLFDFNWGPHGWAEVYFPEYGWVPFDVTYGEYGYLNPSHIELRKSADSSENSAYYSWSSYERFSLISGELDINPSIVEMEGSYISDPDIELIATPYLDSVGFGSYNAIEVTIKNLRNYYLPYAIHISKTESVELHSPNPQLILLKPGEVKKMVWSVSVNPNLADGYVYTFPFNIHSRRNESDTFFFRARKTDPVLTKFDIEKIAQVKEEEHLKQYSNSVRFVCDFDQQFYYVDEPQKVICEITNLGDEALTNLKVCIHERTIDVCTFETVLAVSQKTIELVPEYTPEGIRDIQITLVNDQVSKLDTITQTVLKYPSVSIQDVEYPDVVTFGEEYQLKFIVSGKNAPKDLKINVRVNSLSKTWRLDQLTADREFVLSLDSKDLYPKNNEINIKVIYDDDNDASYNVEQTYTIGVGEIPFLYKLVLYPKMWIERAIQN
jgi:transglutaminase-like putative cysteine protease